MPLYNYQCPAGHAFEVYSSMAKFRRQRRCPRCRKLAGIDLKAQRLATHADLKPFWSEALGKGELDERRPDEHYDRLGRMRIESRAHLKAMQRRYNLGPRRSYVE